MPSDPNVSRLRTLRIGSGLTSSELAEILGMCTASAFRRHERSKCIPNLLTALGYEAVFGVPISELFPGLYRTVKTGVEERLAKMEQELHQGTAKGRDSARVAVKLEFFCTRRGAGDTDLYQ